MIQDTKTNQQIFIKIINYLTSNIELLQNIE